MSSLPLTGHCGCGAVRFEIAEPLTGAAYARDPETKEIVIVRLGAIDGDPGTREQAHRFVAYGLPRFDERIPRT